MHKTTLEQISLRLERRVRFEGDTEPPFWQADVWPDGRDYHAIGDTPYEALMRLAAFWERRTDTAQKQPEATERDMNKAGANGA